jgi:hypothetical protein
MLEPTLAPHEGLPGVDGTSRFCYGVVSAAGGGGTTKPGALAAAIHKAEQAAVASAGGAGVGVAKASGGLPVGPAITPAALKAPAGTAAPPGAPGAPVTGGDTTGVGGTAAGFDPSTGAYTGTAVGAAKVAGTVAPA